MPGVRGSAERPVWAPGPQSLQAPASARNNQRYYAEQSEYDHAKALHAPATAPSAVASAMTSADRLHGTVQPCQGQPAPNDCSELQQPGANARGPDEDAGCLQDEHHRHQRAHDRADRWFQPAPLRTACPHARVALLDWLPAVAAPAASPLPARHHCKPQDRHAASGRSDWAVLLYSAGPETHA